MAKSSCVEGKSMKSIKYLRMLLVNNDQAFVPEHRGYERNRYEEYVAAIKGLGPETIKNYKRRLKLVDRLIYSFLVFQTRIDAKPSIRYVSEWTGICKSMVQRACGNLKAVGLIDPDGAVLAPPVGMFIERELGRGEKEMWQNRIAYYQFLMPAGLKLAQSAIYSYLRNDRRPNPHYSAAYLEKVLGVERQAIPKALGELAKLKLINFTTDRMGFSVPAVHERPELFASDEPDVQQVAVKRKNDLVRRPASETRLMAVEHSEPIIRRSYEYEKLLAARYAVPIQDARMTINQVMSSVRTRVSHPPDIWPECCRILNIALEQPSKSLADVVKVAA